MPRRSRPSRRAVPPTYEGSISDPSVVAAIVEQSDAPAALCESIERDVFVVAENRRGIVGFLHYGYAGRAGAHPPVRSALMIASSFCGSLTSFSQRCCTSVGMRDCVRVKPNIARPRLRSRTIGVPTW